MTIALEYQPGCEHYDGATGERCGALETPYFDRWRFRFCEAHKHDGCVTGLRLVRGGKAEKRGC